MSDNTSLREVRRILQVARQAIESAENSFSAAGDEQVRNTPLNTSSFREPQDGGRSFQNLSRNSSHMPQSPTVSGTSTMRQYDQPSTSITSRAPASLQSMLPGSSSNRTPCRSTVLNELRQNFAPYPRAVRTTARRQAREAPVWAHRFYCLSKVSDTLTPNKNYARLLVENDLGPKNVMSSKLTFRKSRKIIHK